MHLPFSHLPRLADMTTFRVGGTVEGVAHPASEGEFTAALAAADQHSIPLLVLGGGSNILASDEHFPGVVIQDGRSELSTWDKGDHILVTATAGVVWDELVRWSVDQGLSGLEALSGIPGSVGAAPVQNIGAYGQDVAKTLVSIRAWDRDAQEIVELSNRQLELGYRESVMKRSLREPSPSGRIYGPTGRWVVLHVTFALGKDGLSAPIGYSELAHALDVEVGERLPVAQVREAVLGLRSGKAMVLNPKDHDTWSAGSFFTNPSIDEDTATLLPEEAPRFSAGKDEHGKLRVKTSAAWLISHAGFDKGYKVREDSHASLSTRHVLALTNRGDASAAEVVELARAVREGVREKFGITLVPEPVTVNLTI